MEQLGSLQRRVCLHCLGLHGPAGSFVQVHPFICVCKYVRVNENIDGCVHFFDLIRSVLQVDVAQNVMTNVL